MRSYHRKQAAYRAIAQTLAQKGWTVVDDPQLLVRGDLMLCLDASEYYVEQRSGYQRMRQVPVDLGACAECGGTGDDPRFRHITFEWAAANPLEFRRFTVATFGVDRGAPYREKFSASGAWKCSGRDGRAYCIDGRLKSCRLEPDGDPLPTFRATPKGSNWHIERNGVIVAKGRIGYGFDWRSPEHPEWEEFAAYSKAIGVIERGIGRASA